MNVGAIQITVEPGGRALIRADARGLETLAQLVLGAQGAGGWATISDESTGAEKVRVERVATEAIAKLKVGDG